MRVFLIALAVALPCCAFGQDAKFNPLFTAMMCKIALEIPAGVEMTAQQDLRVQECVDHNLAEFEHANRLSQEIGNLERPALDRNLTSCWEEHARTWSDWPALADCYRSIEENSAEIIVYAFAFQNAEKLGPRGPFAGLPENERAQPTMNWIILRLRSCYASDLPLNEVDGCIAQEMEEYL